MKVNYKIIDIEEDRGNLRVKVEFYNKRRYLHPGWDAEQLPTSYYNFFPTIDDIHQNGFH